MVDVNVVRFDMVARRCRWPLSCSFAFPCVVCRYWLRRREMVRESYVKSVSCSFISSPLAISRLENRAVSGFTFADW